MPIWKPTIAKPASESEWLHSPCQFSRTWLRQIWISCIRCLWVRLSSYRNKWNPSHRVALWETKMPNKAMESSSTTKRSRQMAPRASPWTRPGRPRKFRVCELPQFRLIKLKLAPIRKERYFRTKKVWKIIRLKHYRKKERTILRTMFRGSRVMELPVLFNNCPRPKLEAVCRGRRFPVATLVWTAHRHPWPPIRPQSWAYRQPTRGPCYVPWPPKTNRDCTNNWHCHRNRPKESELAKCPSLVRVRQRTSFSSSRTITIIMRGKR